MIICAAIKIEYIDVHGDANEAVICGLRHGDCFKTIRLLSLKRKEKEIQGFINHKGEFLDREEALEHARECGQLSTTHRYYQEDHDIESLYSEDLY